MYVWLVCKTHTKILLSDPETSLMTLCLLSLRHPDGHMETTYHPRCPDHLETFLSDWGDRDDHNGRQSHILSKFHKLKKFSRSELS